MSHVVDNLGLDVYFNVGNFADVAGSYAVGGDVSYTIAGVELAANLEYAESAFSVTPKLIIVY